MEQLRLRPMTDAEFTDFRARLIPSYAADHVRMGDWNADEAEALAARETDNALPEGPRTAGMLVLVAENDGGEQVGNVWVALGRFRPDNAWIYYIETNPGHRGKGYGRALLQAAEEQARQHGARTMGLNVFGANTVARNLYESSGYQATAVVMRKQLAGGDDDLGHFPTSDETGTTHGGLTCLPNQKSSSDPLSHTSRSGPRSPWTRSPRFCRIFTDGCSSGWGSGASRPPELPSGSTT